MKNEETKFGGGQFKRRGLGSGLSGVQLCRTVGATVLHCWCNCAATVGATMLHCTVGIPMLYCWYTYAGLLV